MESQNQLLKIENQLLKIAKAQKGILRCIMAKISAPYVLLLVSLIFPPVFLIAFLFPIAFLFLIVWPLQIYYIHKLAKELGSNSPILWCIGMFIPFLNLILMFILSQNATRRISDSGFKVGLMGANISEIQASTQTMSDARRAVIVITDESLKELAKLKQHSELDLTGADITDEGLKEVAKLAQLSSLNLWNTKTTDAGLKEVAKLGQLTNLVLGRTQITDDGLKELAELKQLSSLNLSLTQITDAGVAQFQKALPKCDIFHDFR